ncbi:RluA family pseudouridine synthase [Paraglaciecola agarilytica]|uniref:RluA family pseudouridine synthase n=1 Tax=Paraglaciecola chathamensis TaxID=368405 RepID=UPI002357ED9E|nr:RluA family pseudouridine synthase [Paraglaciecola agarilytica]|tara:strand:- start:131 stop:832 length:702 start_codon:yes stop_codon:yes gene_type:complete
MKNDNPQKTVETPIVDSFIAPPCFEAVTVLYQDDYLLAVNKPSGLLSLSGKNPLNKDSVHYRIVQQFPTALMAHRLDFGTSGVLLLALDKKSNGELTKQFQARSVKKRYSAVLFGKIQDLEGRVSVPIAKDPANFPRQKICFEQGKEAISHYRVIEYLENPPRTRVEFTPETGRTHQLRIHSLAMGHPILGCDLYANGQSEQLAERLLLHASWIEFLHPHSNQPMTIEAPCRF